MSNTAIWNAALSYTSALSTELNSLASGSVAVASTAIDNTTALNTDGWVSVSLPTVATGTGAPSLDVYLLPLNQDGTTYGDGTATGTVLPGGAYYVGSIAWTASLASGTQTGSLYIASGIPPTKFKLAVVNNIGNALAASGNVVAFASDKLNLNG